MKNTTPPSNPSPDKDPSSTVAAKQEFVVVSSEEAKLAKKVLRILRTGKNAEVRRDARGNPQVFKITREIDN